MPERLDVAGCNLYPWNEFDTVSAQTVAESLNGTRQIGEGSFRVIHTRFGLFVADEHGHIHDSNGSLKSTILAMSEHARDKLFSLLPEIYHQDLAAKPH